MDGMRNNKFRLYNFRMKNFAQKRRCDHQLIERTMKRRIVKVRNGLVLVAAYLLIRMRCQGIMKKVAGCYCDGKHQQQQNGDRFLYDTFLLQRKSSNTSG